MFPPYSHKRGHMIEETPGKAEGAPCSESRCPGSILYHMAWEKARICLGLSFPSCKTGGQMRRSLNSCQLP